LLSAKVQKVIVPSGLAPWCPDPPGRSSPALARAREEREAGRARAAREALGAHLVLRCAAEPSRAGPLRLAGRSARLARIRALLEVPGGASEEARALLDVLDAAEQVEAGEVARALARYAALLEHAGRYEEALEALGVLLRGLQSFRTPGEGCDMALAVARLNVGLTHWDRAAAALDVAEESARAGRDDRRVRLALLSRAALWAAQGRVADARTAVQALLGEAGGDAPSQALSESWSFLGMVLEGEGLRLEALQAQHQAFEQATDDASRRLALIQVGTLLRTLGAVDAARQAFTLVLSGPISFADAVAARLELLELASALDDRVAFERHRLELRAWGGRLPPGAMVEFLLRAAVGLARFEQRGRGWQHLEEAEAVVERHGLAGAGWPMAQVRSLLENPAELDRAVPTDAALSWECHEIAEVAEALQRHAASLYVNA
jgi:tetratricopeptide (TPR) repeat protein